MNTFAHLFKPVTIGNIEAKNRILMSAMSINFGVDDNGYVTDQLIDYFISRAKGGAGMMLVGGGATHPSGQELPDLPTMWDDGCIPALKKMTSRVKKYDVMFGVQLMHGGRQSYLPSKVAPSAIPAPAVVKGEVRALNISEIKDLIQTFGDAALRCRKSGFDFIEIHGAHGYLINQFLSPNSNIRDDEYGGSFENRTRFLFEIIDDIRLKAGENYPVGIRINGNDYIENGWELKDTIRLAPVLEKKGVAYLHISGGVYGSTELTIPSMYTKHGCFIHLAEAVKKEVSIPVITVGRIKDPSLADQVIRDGKADIVSMGRALLADPDLPNKAKEGRTSEIRPCIGCCLGCIHAVLAKEPGSCVVNPDVGREYKIKEDKKVTQPSKILITGAGPAGMAAARLMALRGHQVTLCEKQSAPGGLLSLASLTPGRGELNDILNFFRKELTRLGVNIRYQTPLSDKILEETEPDHVILATGSMPEMPVIKGLFTSGMELKTSVDILTEPSFTGRKVIVLGGGMTGLTTADYLAEKKNHVIVLNRKKHFADEMSANDRFYLRESLKKHGVTLYKKVSVKRFTDDRVEFKSDGKPVTLNGYDTIVISEKMVSLTEAKKIMKQTGIPIHFIGDAKSPRHLMYCISEAEEIARDL